MRDGVQKEIAKHRGARICLHPHIGEVPGLVIIYILFVIPEISSGNHVMTTRFPPEFILVKNGVGITDCENEKPEVWIRF